MDLRARILGSNGQYSRFPLAVFLDEMESLGLCLLDFVPQTPHFFCGYGGHAEPSGLKAELKRRGLRAAALTPPPYRCSICAPNGVQREKTLAYYKSCIALASELECGSLVLDASGACWDLPAESLLRCAAETLEILCAEAEAADVRLLLAPVMGAETPLIAESPVLNTAAELAALLKSIGSPSLGVCLDTNVMSFSGGTLPEWFGILGGVTDLVRLCDGNSHGWRAWGEGVLPMEKYLKQLDAAGYGGYISLRLPGERYIERPWHPDRLAVAALGKEA